VNDYEARQILGPEAYDKLQSKLLNSMLDNQDNLVRCKCGSAIEFSKGEVNYLYKNDEGKQINKTAAKHMSANRVRCPECCNNFCVGCRAEPYHVGKSCA
jgi:IBR domain, a half RING-finger domain